MIEVEENKNEYEKVQILLNHAQRNWNKKKIQFEEHESIIIP